MTLRRGGRPYTECKAALGTPLVLLSLKEEIPLYGFGLLLWLPSPVILLATVVVSVCIETVSGCPCILILWTASGCIPCIVLSVVDIVEAHVVIVELSVSAVEAEFGAGLFQITPLSGDASDADADAGGSFQSELALPNEFESPMPVL
jgi:hypothetical protein